MGFHLHPRLRVHRYTLPREDPSAPPSEGPFLPPLQQTAALTAQVYPGLIQGRPLQTVGRVREAGRVRRAAEGLRCSTQGPKDAPKALAEGRRPLSRGNAPRFQLLRLHCG